MLRAKNIGLRLAYEQWGVSTTSFPISVSAVYSINASKKDTSANSIPDVREYSSTGFKYYGPSPYAWLAVCKAQQWGTYEQDTKVSETKTITLPIAFSDTTYVLTLGQKSDAYWTNGSNVNYVAKTATSIDVYYCDGYGFGWLAIGI